MSASLNLHGTGLVLDGTGLLLRGPSGSGKSLLALALLDRWADGGFLVADDRVEIVRGAPLAMQAPAALAGLIELRGRGIVQRPYRSPAPLHLVVDLVPELIRMPDETEFVTTLLDIALARAPVPASNVAQLGHQVLLVTEAIAALKRKATLP